MCSTWVLATDGKLYRSPVVRGRHANSEWFLCFDNQEPPELVVSQHNAALSDRACLAQAEAILSEIGLEAEVVAGPVWSSRCFGRDASRGPYLRSAAFFLSLRKPVPHQLMSGGGRSQPSGGPCLVYSAGQSWG